MSGDITKTMDPLVASLNALVAVAFPKSSSPSYRLVVTLAMAATHYQETHIDGKPLHVAVFERTPEDAARALAVLERVEKWRGVQVFARGKIVASSWHVQSTLRCYLDSCACSNPQAYCQEVLDDPASDYERNKHLKINLTMHVYLNLPPQPELQVATQIGQFLFPCKQTRYRFRYQFDHPATVKEQIQAAAVEANCDWCPRFDVDDYRQVGIKIVREDPRDV